MNEQQDPEFTPARQEPDAVRQNPSTAGVEHGLQEAIHHMLVLGVAVSSILMVLGLMIGVVMGRSFPTQVPPITEIIPLMVALQPAGFLGLGLLVLIATPIMRVFGSIIAFVYERDWRYAGITLVVFLIVISSILMGRE